MAFKIRVHDKKEAPTLAVVQQAEGWMDQTHRKRLVVGLGVGVAVIVAAAVGLFLDHRAEQKAAVLEATASRLFHEPPPLPQPKEEGKPEPPPEEMDKTLRLKKAALLYDEVLETYPGSASAAVARYAIGHVRFELKEYDLAEQKFLAFIGAQPDEKEWVALVKLKLGILRQMKGDKAAALQSLREVYDLEGVRIRDQAGFELGRFLEEDSKKEEAIAIYKKVSEAFEKSPWGTEAKARLNILNPPTAVAPASSTPPPSAALSAAPLSSPLLKVVPTGKPSTASPTPATMP
jgi:tetratricopeptide (TPR) repeat protein